jgi:hypothetical protein
MSARLCVAVAIAALTFAGVERAGAADLYGENYYPPPEAEPYDDPSYAEGDRYPPPATHYNDDDDAYRPDRYVERDAPYRDDYPYRGSTKDGGAYIPPSRFADRDYGRPGPCVSRWQIRSRLHDEGWVNIRPLDRQGETSLLRARRADSGRIFTLRVDRCSGEIVDARPHYLRTFGAYAPRPWERPRPY